MVQLFLEPHQLRRVNREFVTYVRRNFPMRFYRREGKWPVCATAALLRMCDTVDSIMTLMGRQKLGDGRALLRSLYEQVVVFSWVAMDPATRLERWEGASRKEQLKLHNEALRYGETILTPKEAKEFAAAPGVPATATMARELDEYWPGRVPGLHEAGGLLSFHGLYQGVYRVGSRQTHGTFAALIDMCEAGRAGDRARPSLCKKRLSKTCLFTRLRHPYSAWLCSSPHAALFGLTTARFSASSIVRPPK